MLVTLRWLLLIFFAKFWELSNCANEARIVCYYTNWSVYRPGTAKFSPQNINPYLCTHLIYAFGGFTKENTLKPFDKYQDIEKGGYAKFTGLKTYNKNLKTMLAIGGWNEGSSRFSPMVASAERRRELVKNIIKFLRQYHFDGLDLDWEYPSFRDGGKPRDKENYAQFVQELRDEFDREFEKTGRPRLLLTMAVPAGIEYINKGYDIPKLTKYLDWMNILSYDYHSAFEPAVNHHAPLYPIENDTEYNYDADLNIDYTIKHYLKVGADKSKLVLGIPTYGRSYTLFNPDANEIGAPADGPGSMGDATRENGYLAFYEICENIKSENWTVKKPYSNLMGPYAYKENQWVGYDDEDIARKKARYVIEKGLGGIMFWSIDNDDFRGNCYGKSYPLIEAAKEELLSVYRPTHKVKSTTVKSISSGRNKVRRKSTTTTTTTTEGPSRSESTLRRNRIRLNNRKTTPSQENKSRKQVSNESRRRSTTPSYSTPSYTTPSPPTTPDLGADFKCEDEGFFPHPRDCKKYFWCLNGASDTGIVAHQFTCPAGLYFNKAADSCDYSQNVLCNKKRSKASSTTPKTTTTTAQAIQTTSSRRTSTTRTTTTTADYEDEEYDYEDVDDTTIDSKDPRVIKELLDLIKKAGGIEELEKQLAGRDGEDAGNGSEATTKSAAKNIYERVLNRVSAKSSTFSRTTPKYTSLNRNNRGPQSDQAAIEDSKSTSRGRPQYTYISRKQPNSKSEGEESTAESSQAETPPLEKIRERSRSEKKEYVTIQRNRFGNSDSNTEDTSSDRSKNTDEANTKATPKYVTIRRNPSSDTTTTEYATSEPHPFTSRTEKTEKNTEINLTSSTSDSATVSSNKHDTRKLEASSSQFLKELIDFPETSVVNTNTEPTDIYESLTEEVQQKTHSPDTQTYYYVISRKTKPTTPTYTKTTTTDVPKTSKSLFLRGGQRRTTPRPTASSSTKKINRRKNPQKNYDMHQADTSQDAAVQTIYTTRIPGRYEYNANRNQKSNSFRTAEIVQGSEKYINLIPEHSKVLVHSTGIIECLDQGNFPHPASCKKFISCAKMENDKLLGWEYTCPKDLSFDPVGGICNWAAEVGCIK